MEGRVGFLGGFGKLVGEGRRQVVTCRWRCGLSAGTVLTSSGRAWAGDGKEGGSGDEVFHLRDAVLLVFEHTEKYGTGALVVNRATPVQLSDLGIPQFDLFGLNLIYQGGPLASRSDVVLGDQAPWYWIHDDGAVQGARHLSGDIYMGGRVFDSEALLANPQRIKFFWRHTFFKPGQLQSMTDSGQLIKLPCTTNVVLFDEVEGKQIPRVTQGSP